MFLQYSLHTLDKYKLKLGLLILAFFTLFNFGFKNAFADQDQELVDPGAPVFEGYLKGKIVQVVFEESSSGYDREIIKQLLKVNLKLKNGKDEIVEIEHREIPSPGLSNLKTGDSVIVAQLSNGGKTRYEIVDRYRLPGLYVLIGIFILSIFLVSGGKGLASQVGLLASLIIILKFLVPRLIVGSDYLSLVFLSALVIAVLLIFTEKGINRRSILSLFSVILLTLIHMGFALGSLGLLKLRGSANEETDFVQSYFSGVINLKSLLFASLVLGMIGFMCKQVCSAIESSENFVTQNPHLGIWKLFKNVLLNEQGKVSRAIYSYILLITVVAFPLFLLFSVQTEQPTWVLLNSEYTMEIIAKILVGGIILLLCVPVSALIGVLYFKKNLSK